jgi:hypothetical protein
MSGNEEVEGRLEHFTAIGKQLKAVSLVVKFRNSIAVEKR